MGEDNLEDPTDLAKRARRQGKHAVKNAGKAARVAAEPALEEAKEVVDKLEDTAEDAFKTAQRFSPRMLGILTGDLGVAFLGLGVAIYTGTVSMNKFRSVYNQRGKMLKTVVKESQTYLPDDTGA